MDGQKASKVSMKLFLVNFAVKVHLSKEMCEEWILDNPALVKGYKPKDIINADKTGLFYQCLPDKTAMFKNEECREGKQSEVHTAKTLLVSFQ